MLLPRFTIVPHFFYRMERPGPNFPNNWSYGQPSYVGRGPAKPMFQPHSGYGATPQPQVAFQPNACFMPAANLRKISNNTPQRYYDSKAH
ncbi:hypothetical protein O3G_MSEX001772 [Manduca sexta]|uniref:Uncharacterized protein n=1 Tax=Manduca sexta TaxID=7130 RepID=A0A922CDE4_MANSE|nr:hypothetical protein O3G_MSEX001772 [Manduca sexta]